MNNLLQTYTLLAAGLRADTQFCLASAVVWLDPMWQDADEDWDVPHDEDGTIGVALTVTRKAFPDIYSQAVEAIRQGASYTDIDRLICDGITERGIPLDNLEWIGFGVPMPAYGVELNDSDFYTTHSEVIPILACFGISPEPNPYHMTIPDCVYTAGRTIAADLEKHPDEHYRQISWLMQWLWSSSGNSSILCGIETEMSSNQSFITDSGTQLEKIYTIGGIIAESLEQQEAEQYQQLSWTIKWMFSCSNNSCVDWDEETMYSVEPLAWTPEDVAFAIEIIAEAQTIMADAEAGLAWVKDEAGVLLALWYNTQQIDQMLVNNPERPVEVCLTWPDLSQDPAQQVKILLDEWGYPAGQ